MRVLFLGETYRADARTWINGLKEFGNFEVHTWELEKQGQGIKKLLRMSESIFRLVELHNLARKIKPDLIVAERTTSYGFLAATLHQKCPVVIAQQGITDIYPPRSLTVPIKILLQKYAFKHASLIHAWGETMTYSMIQSDVDPLKILILAKGIDLRNFKFHPNLKDNKIRAIVTRSFAPEYRHEIIIKAFHKLKIKKIPFELVLVGQGYMRQQLEGMVLHYGMKEMVVFTGVISNNELPAYLSQSDLYISMPCTEGVSSSLFEAFASGCYPIVSDVPGNRAWIKDNINGRLITVDDYEMLSKGIEDYYYTRDNLQPVLVKNRITVEQKASFERNMSLICSKYLDIVKLN